MPLAPLDRDYSNRPFQQYFSLRLRGENSAPVAVRRLTQFRDRTGIGAQKLSIGLMKNSFDFNPDDARAFDLLQPAQPVTCSIDAIAQPDASGSRWPISVLLPSNILELHFSQCTNIGVDDSVKALCKLAAWERIDVIASKEFPQPTFPIANGQHMVEITHPLVVWVS